MLFEELMYAELDEGLIPTVEKLLVMKKSMKEMGTAPKIQILNDYIEKMLPQLREKAEQMVDERESWREIGEDEHEVGRESREQGRAEEADTSRQEEKDS